MQEEKLAWKDWLAITCETLHALAKAWEFRFWKRKGMVTLPPKGEDCSLSDTIIRRISLWIDLVVGILLFWKPGRCFYRSYALAVVLRKRGIPLILNFGYRNLGGRGRIRAHCWVTFKGSPFAEKTNPLDAYPIKMGETEGHVTYWLGCDEAASTSKVSDLRSNRF